MNIVLNAAPSPQDKLTRSLPASRQYHTASTWTTNNSPTTQRYFSRIGNIVPNAGETYSGSGHRPFLPAPQIAAPTTTTPPTPPPSSKLSSYSPPRMLECIPAPSLRLNPRVPPAPTTRDPQIASPAMQTVRANGGLGIHAPIPDRARTSSSGRKTVGKKIEPSVREMPSRQLQLKLKMLKQRQEGRTRERQRMARPDMDDEDDEDDVTDEEVKQTKVKQKQKTTEVRARSERDKAKAEDNTDSEDEIPPRTRKRKTRPLPTAFSDSDDDIPLAKRARRSQIPQPVFRPAITILADDSDHDSEYIPEDEARHADSARSQSRPHLIRRKDSARTPRKGPYPDPGTRRGRGRPRRASRTAKPRQDTPMAMSDHGVGDGKANIAASTPASLEHSRPQRPLPTDQRPQTCTGTALATPTTPTQGFPNVLGITPTQTLTTTADLPPALTPQQEAIRTAMGAAKFDGYVELWKKVELGVMTEEDVHKQESKFFQCGVEAAKKGIRGQARRVARSMLWWDGEVARG